MKLGAVLIFVYWLALVASVLNSVLVKWELVGVWLVGWSWLELELVELELELELVEFMVVVAVAVVVAVVGVRVLYVQTFCNV